MLYIPNEVRTDNQKLAYLYRYQEKLRLWHNELGAKHKTGEIDDRRWLNFLYVFKPLNLELCKEINKIKTPIIRQEIINKINPPHPDGTTFALKLPEEKDFREFDYHAWKRPFKEDTVYDNTIKDEINALEIPDLDLVFVDPLEDFENDYTEVDPNSHISLATVTASFANLSNDEAAYVYKDFDAGHFGDFEHLHELIITAADANFYTALWLISNTIADLSAHSDYGMYLYSYQQTALYGGNWDTGNYDSGSFTLSNRHYLTTERSGTTQTHKVYSDATRETLLDTLTCTCGTTTYRYLYGLCSADASNSRDGSGDSRNLDIQEAVAGKKRLMMMGIGA